MNCNLCGGRLEVFLNLGRVALAGGFLRPEEVPAEQKHPLRVGFCPECYAVQVVDRVDPERLFSRYFYHSSAIPAMRAHFRRYAQELVARFAPRRVVEVGCNDGVMLAPLHDCGVEEVIGVDPAPIVPKLGAIVPKVIKGYFNRAMAEEIGRADVVVANNVFAHIPDLNDATAAVAKLIGRSGVFVFEVHYLGKLLAECQYDAIYHEHVYYHSLLALDNLLARHGLFVFDVQPIPTHAGTMRFYACARGVRPATPGVLTLRAAEINAGLNMLETYRGFARDALHQQQALAALVHGLQADGKRVAGYGASGRAATLLQVCDIRLDYVVDDAPAKHGHLMPGTHAPIVPFAALQQNEPDYLLITAWPYFDQINPKLWDCGAKLIVPLPEIVVYPSPRRSHAALVQQGV